MKLMFTSTYAQSSREFVNNLLSYDAILVARMYEKDIKTNEIYKLYRERLELYEKAYKLPLIESDCLLLIYKRREICNELRMFKRQKDLEDGLERTLLIHTENSL
jgi:hypothetical protein